MNLRHIHINSKGSASFTKVNTGKKFFIPVYFLCSVAIGSLALVGCANKDEEVYLERPLEELYNKGVDHLDDGDYNGGFGYYHLEGKFGANIGAVEWQPGWRTDVEFEWPEELRFIKSATLDMGNIDRLPQEPDVSGKSYREIIEEDEDLSNTIIDQCDSHFRLIGYPIFK